MSTRERKPFELSNTSLPHDICKMFREALSTAKVNDGAPLCDEIQVKIFLLICSFAFPEEFFHSTEPDDDVFQSFKHNEMVIMRIGERNKKRLNFREMGSTEKTSGDDTRLIRSN